MLQVKPKNRVSCAKILGYPFICRKLEERFRVEGEKGEVLLKTIEIPKNLMYLSNCLPKADYSVMKLRKTLGNVEKKYVTKSVYLSLNVANKRNKENSRYRFKSRKLRKGINLPNLNNKKLGGKKDKENKVFKSNLNLKLNKRLDSQTERKKINLVQIKSINRIPLTKKYYNPYIKNKKLKKNIKLKPIKL